MAKDVFRNAPPYSFVDLLERVSDGVHVSIVDRDDESHAQRDDDGRETKRDRREKDRSSRRRG